MSTPLLSVRAELVRAAMHFTPKGQCARDFPERAGVRFEPAPNGVVIIAMDDDAMLVLRDLEGECRRACTISIQPSFFDAARRQQRASKLKARDAILSIGNGEAHLSGVTHPAPEIEEPYPNWRRLMPGRAYGLPPAIDPHDAERIAIAGGILTGGVRYSGATDRDVALASFCGWPDAFAVVSPIPDSSATGPWLRPLWTVEAAFPVARAS